MPKKCAPQATNWTVRLGGWALKARASSSMAATPSADSAPGAWVGTMDMES